MTLVVVSQSRGFSGNSLEDIVDERVHNRHGFAADPCVRMDLLQDFVDVGGVRLLAGLLPFLVPNSRSGLLPGLLGSFGRHFRRHGDDVAEEKRERDLNSKRNINCHHCETLI